MKYIKSFGKLFESTKSRAEFKSGDAVEFHNEVERLVQKYGFNLPPWKLLNQSFWDRAVKPGRTVYLFELDEPLYLNPVTFNLETISRMGKAIGDNKVSMGPHIIYAIVDDHGRFWGGFNQRERGIDEELVKSLIEEKTVDPITELKETLIDLLTPITDCGFRLDANWKVRSYSEKALYINLTSQLNESVMNKSDLIQCLELIIELVPDWDYKLSRLFLADEKNSINLDEADQKNLIESVSKLDFNPTKIFFVFTPLS